MHHAFAVLRLAPDMFWTMTPREFASALPARRNEPISRQRFLQMCAAFPDKDIPDD